MLAGTTFHLAGAGCSHAGSVAAVLGRLALGVQQGQLKGRDKPGKEGGLSCRSPPEISQAFSEASGLCGPGFCRM